MATRSLINAKCKDGKIKSIYVHYDGADPLPTLKNNYDTQEKVEELIAVGDLSTLEETLADCRKYNDPALKFNSFQEAKLRDADQEYIYEWNGTEWSMERVEGR